jgi:hypothetical protein
MYARLVFGAAQMTCLAQQAGLPSFGIQMKATATPVRPEAEEWAAIRPLRIRRTLAGELYSRVTVRSSES